MLYPRYPGRTRQYMHRRVVGPTSLDEAGCFFFGELSRIDVGPKVRGRARAPGYRYVSGIDRITLLPSDNIAVEMACTINKKICILL